MKDTFTAFLSIGSNKGDKKRNLEDAIGLLNKSPNTRIVSVSSFYKTEPQNFKDQNWFVNAALKIETELDPGKLMSLLKSIELTLDKQGKEFRFGPRIIDLDIIFFEDKIIDSDFIKIPHPRMHERCFVLRPLCDIGADVVHPVLNLRSDELLKRQEKEASQQVIPLD